MPGEIHLLAGLGERLRRDALLLRQQRETGLVATTKSTVDNVIKRDQLDLLPVAGRNAANLAMLAPGVVPRGSTEEPVTSEGQPRGSTEALLDGVSNKLVLINSIRSKSTTRRPITPTSAR